MSTAVNHRLKIIYEDADLLVIDKPAGVLVHPTRTSREKTIVDALLAYNPRMKSVGEDPLRPGIVHRLDRNTSGLLITAKNQASFQRLKQQFQDRRIIKRYLALIVGRVKDDQGIIAKSITISRKGGRRSALLDKRAKKAITRYVVKKRFAEYTLLDVQIETGRTHQIRVHLASIGHPVAGDREYKFKRQICPDGLTRQFLHAYYLKFRLSNGKLLELESVLPPDLAKVVKDLK